MFDAREKHMPGVVAKAGRPYCGFRAAGLPLDGSPRRITRRPKGGLRTNWSTAHHPETLQTAIPSDRNARNIPSNKSRTVGAGALSGIARDRPGPEATPSFKMASWQPKRRVDQGEGVRIGAGGPMAGDPLKRANHRIEGCNADIWPCCPISASPAPNKHGEGLTSQRIELRATIYDRSA